MSRVIDCRPGQSIMAAADEHGLRIHPRSPTPGLSIEGVERWASQHGIAPVALVRVRWDECFVAVDAL